MSGAFDRIADFALGAPEIPGSARAMAARLLIDTVAVTAGAASLEVGRIARDLAVDLYGPGSGEWSAPIMFDGRRASLAGAAFAAATQTDNLDAHDGLNPTKGHIGCAVVPALIAFAERRPGLRGRAALDALVIAYEIAARAAIALHGSVSDYHTSGAWNGLGVAALGVRLMGGEKRALRHALGIAEYHGPRSQMMREIDNPTMLHDGSGMGALVGVSSAVMSMRGFTGAPAITVEGAEVSPIWDDLGSDWTIERNYIKPYPVCRWAHAALDATRALMRAEGFGAGDVAKVRVATFAEAARLFPGMPDTTSKAQYSLGFAVATMLRKGAIGPDDVSGAALSDTETAKMIDRIEIVEDARHSSRFPAGRWSDVAIDTYDGRRFASGDVHARGGPEAPMSNVEFAEKLTALAGAPLAEALLTLEATLPEDAPFSGMTDLTAQALK
ncbi:MAG: MmgE/PrpD family protein [Pseudomonadota bacterium]